MTRIKIEDLDLILEGKDLKMNGKRIEEDVIIKVFVNGRRLKDCIDLEDKTKMLEVINKKGILDSIVDFLRGN